MRRACDARLGLGLGLGQAMRQTMQGAQRQAAAGGGRAWGGASGASGASGVHREGLTEG